jgi:LysR family transcriptional regulator, glycine cleavage system transcriptional activator
VIITPCPTNCLQSSLQILHAMPIERPLVLAGLRGFESAARHLSLTKAATELNLSQSALSRQVQGLEAALGVPLFVRKAREIMLTPAGSRLLAQAQASLTALDQTVQQIRLEAHSPRIAVSTFASFASLWLIPRLAKFRALRPQVDLDIGASDRMVDLASEGFDLAIRFLPTDHAPVGAILLFEDTLFPLVGENYLKSAPALKQLSDLSKHTLIESTATSPGELRTTWASYFQALGSAQIKGRSRLNFDYIAQSFLAAERGQGVALARTYGADTFMSGSLIRALPQTVRAEAGCFLLCSPISAQRPDVQAFTDWVQAEAKRFQQALNRWMKQQAAT